MAVPTTGEVAIPIGLTTLGLTAAFGHDWTFWVVVVLAVFMKWRYSDPVTDRDGEPLSGRRWLLQIFINLLAAIIPAYVFTRAVADLLGVPPGSPIYLGIAFLLVISGDGLVRWAIRTSKRPDAFVEMFIRAWRGGK